MLSNFIISVLSVIIVSLISLIGIFFIGVKSNKIKKILIYMISFSAGALFGDAFLHLLPHVIEESFTTNTSIYLLGGIVLFFVLEKFIRWQHCHQEITDIKHVHPFAYMNLLGDALHNFLDGIIIAVSFMASFPIGIATTIAVLLHEIPQEIGDFGVLVHGGFTKRKALFVNFASALTALLGVIIAFVFADVVENIEAFAIPLVIGGFIYIAGSDLIPEIHKHSNEIKVSLLQLLSFILGIVIMAVLLLVE